jgi:hypothetical protein
VVVVDIPGVGNTLDDDLLVGTDQNNPPSGGNYSTVRNNAGALSVIANGVSLPLTSGNKLFLKTTGPEFVGAVARNGANDQLQILAPTNAFLNTITTATVQRGSRFIPGKFAAGSFNHLLVYRPGQSNFFSHISSEPVANTYALSAGTSFDLGAAISQMILISGPTADRFLAIFTDGSAKVYSFDGAASPTLIQSIAADPGERITSVAPTGAHDFMVFSGTGNVSATYRPYKVSGGVYAAGAKLSLPAVSPLAGDANVFLFTNEPFVSVQPGLLRSVSAGDWTSDFAIVAGAPNTFTANVWNYESSTLGLRNPTANISGPWRRPPGLVW